MDPHRGISYGIVQPGRAVNDGVPIVRVANVREGQIDTSAPLRVAAEVEKTYGRTRLRGGELLITIVGTVGETAIVPTALAGWNVARAIAVLPVVPEIGAYWIRLALKSSAARSMIESRLNTTVQATLNLSDLARLPIPVPPAREREAIASVLGALDDKIELNRRMNETLEAMARAIFQDWFVAFGPTRAKMEGRPPYLAPDLWALFPDRLDAEGKPEGWQHSTVGCEFRLTMGQSPPGETYNTRGDGLPFFQGRSDFGFRYPGRRMFCTVPSRIAQKDDTLISVRAPVGDLNVAAETCCIGRGVASARHRLGGPSYTYYALGSIQSQLEAFEHTGTVFGSINKAQFEALPILAPPDGVVNAFEAMVSAFDDRIRLNHDEAEILAATRDLLLPRLMSGELRVKDAERAVEATA